MAKITTQRRDRPWLPDDRRNDDRLKEFFSTEPPTLGWLLMEAWDDANVGISFGLGAIVAARKSDAEKTDDVRMSRWMLDIGNRILETPTGRDAKAGELTREQLLDAAYDRVVAAGNDALILSSERESLQTESLRRTAAPLRRLIDEFNKELATLAVSDVPSAGYLRGVVSDLQKLVGADDVQSLVAQKRVTGKKAGKARRDDLSPVIDVAREFARDRNDPAELWNTLTGMASEAKPRKPLIEFKDGEILWGDPVDPDYLDKDACAARLRRLIEREKNGA